MSTTFCIGTKPENLFVSAKKVIPSGSLRVFRGGCFVFVDYLRVSDRNGAGPSGSADDLGFRCCSSE